MENPYAALWQALRGGFELGDRLLLLDTSGQGQSFLILCKVVDL